MIHIDGSYGEGGGQILRTAVSLSVLTDTPVKITSIRANRPNPGLRPQHHLALSVMQQLSDAEVKGLGVGSTEIVFHPHTVKGGSFSFDIGTAGSMVLVFQTIILGLLKSHEPVQIRLCGGSDVKWSPSWDYFTEVFLPVIQQMGVKVSARLVSRGYYPKGGGEAEIILEPLNQKVSPVSFTDLKSKQVHGHIHLGNLPDHIAKRMKHTAAKELIKDSIHCSIQSERSETRSSGVVLTLWAGSDKGVLGTVGLGEKGVPAETVAKNAVEHIQKDIHAQATVDVCLSDQILPYLACAKEESTFYVRFLSGHFKTNLWVITQFFPDFTSFVVERERSVKVICKNK